MKRAQEGGDEMEAQAGKAGGQGRRARGDPDPETGVAFGRYIPPPTKTATSFLALLPHLY